jgi:hypothetical protein
MPGVPPPVQHFDPGLSSYGEALCPQVCRGLHTCGGEGRALGFSLSHSSVLFPCSTGQFAPWPDPKSSGGMRRRREQPLTKAPRLSLPQRPPLTQRVSPLVTLYVLLSLECS